MEQNENKKKKKKAGLFKGLKLTAFGLVTTISAGVLTYFLAPGANGGSVDSSEVPGDSDDPYELDHGDMLFANIAGMSSLTLNDLKADIVLPDNDSVDSTNNHIGLNGKLALSMPTLSRLALNVDSTLTYYSPDSESKPVQKDLDITYLGKEKNLYLALTDTKKENSGIRYSLIGTDYDDLIDTIADMLANSIHFSGTGSSTGSDDTSSSGGLDTSDLMNSLSMKVVEDKDNPYTYTFTIDLGKENWDPIELKMSSDSDCNLTGVWTDPNKPISIPLGNEQYCTISLEAREASMTEETTINAPANAASYSRMINSTSLMKRVFNMVDKESFSLQMGGSIVHSLKNEGSEKLDLGAKFEIDYLNNTFDLIPTLSSVIDTKEYAYSPKLMLRPVEDKEKANLYLDYEANGASVGKLNFTNVLSVDKFLTSILDSFNEFDDSSLQKIMDVFSYFTDLTGDIKKVIGNGEEILSGEGAPTNTSGVKEGTIYEDSLTNTRYTFTDGEWVKQELTLLDEIKAGHYQGCFDLIKNVSNGDNTVSITLTLAPFGLSDDATITIVLDGNDGNNDLASIVLGNLEFSDFTLSEFAIKVNDLKDDHSFASLDSSSFMAVNNMPGLFDEFATLADEQKASLSLTGSLAKGVESTDKSLSNLDFEGKIAFDGSLNKPGAKASFSLNQKYANALDKNVLHSLALEMGEVAGEDASSNSEYLTKFAYQSKDKNELASGVDKGGLYGKGYISSVTDLLKYLRNLLSDEQEILTERVVNPIRSLTDLIAIKAGNDASKGDEKAIRYFSFLKTSYITGMSSATVGEDETLSLTLNGSAFGLEEDVKINLVRFASDNGEHKAGELKSLDIEAKLSEKKTLDLSIGIEKYNETGIVSCPSESATLKYYDFSSLSTLAKFGINTGLFQTSYYWKGSVSVSLAQLHSVIDVDINLYIKASGSSLKMMGDFSLPLIPDVNGPTENAPAGLREMAGLGTRKVEFAYSSSSEAKDSLLYFHGVSDVKGNVYDKEDYACFSLEYAINHPENVFLGYVMDLYPSLLSTKDDSSASEETSTKTDISLDNEYDSIIQDYVEPGYGNNGTWSLTLDAAALLGQMSIASDSFSFEMDATHVALTSLSATTFSDILENVSLDLKVYLGINLQVNLSLDNVGAVKNADSGRYTNTEAEDKFAENGEFEQFISGTNFAKDTVKSCSGKLDQPNREFTIDESWVLIA